ncbi:hypothetical protein GCM10027569_25430 [Flindersiella endophytica]
MGTGTPNGTVGRANRGRRRNMAVIPATIKRTISMTGGPEGHDWLQKLKTSRGQRSMTSASDMP